ncbi:MAG: IreB family regulatory phosphoprotein [Oscillospiraceae bacterium]|nr:IreB family regulatory phosphoprotein [Oscillospiraceae bacterium]
MEDTKFIAAMESIVSSIEKTGMDPYSQLYGYLTTGKEEYITRTGNARELIKALNWQWVWDFVKQMKKDVD